MGRLPEAWIAPPATRELRELVRHRAKLVGIRSNCQVQIHAVLAKCGIQVSMTDLFGLAGTELLDRLKLPKPYAARIASLRRIITALDFEIDAFAGQVRARLVRDPGFLAVQATPGVGSRWAAIESVQILPRTSVVGRIRDRVGDRRGNRHIGVVAAARHQLEFVFYALRDHRVRALQGARPVAA